MSGKAWALVALVALLLVAILLAVFDPDQAIVGGALVGLAGLGGAVLRKLIGQKSPAPPPAPDPPPPPQAREKVEQAGKQVEAKVVEAKRTAEDRQAEVRRDLEVDRRGADRAAMAGWVREFIGLPGAAGHAGGPGGGGTVPGGPDPGGAPGADEGQRGPGAGGGPASGA